MKVFKSLFIQLIVLIFLTIAVKSQDIEVNIKDTVINRGGINYIPVLIKSDSGLKGLLYFELKFNAYVIDIKNLHIEIPNNEFVSIIDHSTDLSDLKNAVLKLHVDLKTEVVSGGFMLEVEGLAGADTTTLITPVKAQLDSLDIPDSKFNPGKITVRSTPIIPGITEGLRLNYPNPFTVKTTFPFGLNLDTKISFAVYGMGGRKILDDDNITEIFNIAIIQDSAVVSTEYKNKVFKRGNYSLSLQPYNWQLSAGVYFIVMQTESGVYKNNFMYIK